MSQPMGTGRWPEGSEGADAAWGHPHWAHLSRDPTWLQGELLHLWGLVSLGGFLLNLA